MPDFDPTIPLKLVAPPAPPNPLDTYGKYLSLQNQGNQTQLLRNQLLGREKLGQIMAAAPDIDTGLDQASHDPQIAGWVPDLVSNLREQAKTQAEIGLTRANTAKTELDINQGSIKGVANALASGDPSQVLSAVSAAISSVPPAYRANAKQYAQGIYTALFDGLPSDPKTWSPADLAEYRKRGLAQAAVAGWSKDQRESANGAPALVNQGSQLQPGSVNLATGGITPSGAPFGIGSPPQYSSLGGQPVALGPILPGGGGGQQSFQLPSGGGASGGTGPGPGPGHASAPGPASPPPLSAFDGSPLVPPGFSPPNQSSARSALGTPILNPNLAPASDELQKKFAGPELENFRAAGQALGSLQLMNSALDSMAKSGGVLTPGSGAPARTELAKAVNTVYQMFGAEPPVDPTTIAKIEDMNKEAFSLGAVNLSRLFGDGREAASTILESIKAVPNISNTALGGKLVLSALQAAAERQQDQRQFKSWWLQQPSSAGSLLGADEAFTQLHPAERYSDAVLGKLGMSSKGFISPQAVAEAVRNGLLTQKQGLDTLHSQFPEGPGGHQ